MRTNLIIIAFILIGTGVQSQVQITAEKIGDKIEFRSDGNLLTNYILSEHEKYPFFYPVNGPSKASVTSMRNGNYPHHSSLFFGCDRVNGGNYWQEGLERGQIISMRADIIETGSNKAVIENECIWSRPGADAPIKDKRIITVTWIAEDKYYIDFNITMEMLMDVTINKTNHSFLRFDFLALFIYRFCTCKWNAPKYSSSCCRRYGVFRHWPFRRRDTHSFT